MITAITVKCDWPGCEATHTADCILRPLRDIGWKIENADSRQTMFLCPAHKRKRWDEVREAQFRRTMRTAPGTP